MQKTTHHSLFSLFLFMGLAFSFNVHANTLSISLKDQNNDPVEDAVVALYPQGNIDISSIPAIKKGMMTQSNMTFVPHVLVVTKNAEVSFPNEDDTRHHVYSFSTTKTFELRLYGGDEEKSVTFEKSGVVALGCNIHDSMLGYIFVSETPIVRKSMPDGQITFTNLPKGEYKMEIWHPRLKTNDSTMYETININNNATANIDETLNLRRKRRVSGNY